MIEFIAEERCTSCGKCVEVCPQDVFDLVAGAAPLISRAEDCTTCRQCSLYCPQGAIYVALLTYRRPDLDREKILAEGRTTRYADWLGWSRGQPPRGDRSGLEYQYGLMLAEKRGNAYNVPDPSDRVRSQLFDARERNLI
jgi:NAD-dependent dihydropyrimidine dehydrogenase PreA subunit